MHARPLDFMHTCLLHYTCVVAVQDMIQADVSVLRTEDHLASRPWMGRISLAGKFRNMRSPFSGAHGSWVSENNLTGPAFLWMGQKDGRMPRNAQECPGCSRCLALTFCHSPNSRFLQHGLDADKTRKEQLDCSMPSHIPWNVLGAQG
jgi:hypothetical protein